MKKICLCVTNYKKEFFLERSIRSCLSQIQNEFNIEVIVVNDGSKNFEEKKIVREFPNIKVISYKNNKGVAYASNTALKKTNADYYMRVDADDYISTKSVIILSEILNENPAIPFVYGDILKIKKNGINEKLKRNKKETLLEHGAGVLFRTKYLKKIRGYDRNLRNCEDFDLIARMEIKYGDGYYIPVPYYRYYITNSSHLSKSFHRKKYINLLKKKYEKYLSKNFK
jgi:glycosyltransferase involved in cell wall biosynthesis